MGFRPFAHQLLLAAIACATGTVFWFFQGAAALLYIFIYTFIIGNLTAFVMGASASLFSRLSLSAKWIAFLCLLVPTGIVGGILASLLIYALQPSMHATSLRPFLVQNVRIGLFITLLTGTVMFASQLTRARLEAANLKLQDQVQLGAMRLQNQAAELTAAHEIQLHLIPTNFPQVPGLQVSGAWQPAQAVGGDYFDVLSFDRKHLALCIGDVSGKGMAAALLMANLQAAFRAFATEETPADIVCGKLNRALCTSIAPGKFVTFFYGVVDVTRLLFSYENAGHNPPILLRRGTMLPLAGGGTVLGLFPDAAYAERTLQLIPGDCLLFTTDGITEAYNPASIDEEFGEARLTRSAQQARAQGAYAIRSRILEDVTRFCEGHFHDDASLIVLTVDHKIEHAL